MLVVCCVSGIPEPPSASVDVILGSMWLRSVMVDSLASLSSSLDAALGDSSSNTGSEELDSGAARSGDPRIALCFADPSHDLAGLTSRIHRQLGVPCLGATTAGELDAQGLRRGSAVIAVIGGDDVRVRAVKERDTSNRAEDAASAMTVGFHDDARRYASEGFGQSSTLLLTDGLSGGGEELAAALHRKTRPHQQIVGGAAGDAGRFRRTQVALDGVALTEGAVAAHVFSRAALGVGLGTGLRPASRRFVVTRAEGTRVYELDGAPAIDAYVDFAKESGRPFDRGSPGTFFVHHELGIYFFDEVRFARAPLVAMADGSLVCAASVPVGSSVCILDGTGPDLVRAAEEAGREAQRNLGRACGGALAFDCICRGLILGDTFGDEVGAIRGALRTDQVAGFLTYGEIARYRGTRQGWHNATAVVVALPA